MATLRQLGDRRILVRNERDDCVARVKDSRRWQRNLLAGLGFEFADIRRFEFDTVEDEHRFVAEFEVDSDAFLLEDLYGVLDGRD